MPENIKTIIIRTLLRSFITANKIDFEPQDIAINSFNPTTEDSEQLPIFLSSHPNQRCKFNQTQ
jgi:hypothetical protein